MQPVSRITTLNGPRVRGISPVGNGNGLWRLGFAEEPSSLSSELKTERVRDDASGDGEDGEDELPCVIGESEGDKRQTSHLVESRCLHSLNAENQGCI